MANKQKEILDLQNQSSVAKLLATENITVTHSSNLKTAHFDIKNRVLGLPVWENKGKVVYDMLVGHEVSHALYTPNDKFEAFLEKYGRKNFDVLNIVEDIRIERLIQKKYAGMPRIFNGAYKDLHESDFFGIADKNVNDLLFVDRLNLKGKLRNFVDIEFNAEEKSLYESCLKANTFDEVVELYEKIVEYTKKEKEEKAEAENQMPAPQMDSGESEESQEQQMVPSEGEGESGDESESYIPEAGDVEDGGTESHSIESELSDEEKEAVQKMVEEALAESKDGDDSNTGEKGVGKVHTDNEDVITEVEKDEGITSETQEAFNENINGEQEEDRYAPSIALWPKKSTVKNQIIDYKTVMAARPEDAFKEGQERYERYGKDRNLAHDYAVFKKNINKKTGVLVREFERRKAAYQYSRAQESRRGSLDVNNLHKYKYDDQIFQTTMRLADAKSHGMIFFIDYSGSMGGVLQDVLEHTLNLIHFCKKVGIPFEVYSFTSNYSLSDSEREEKYNQSDYEFDMSDLVCAQLFSSEMSKAEYELAFKQVSYQVMLSGNDSYYRSFSQCGVSRYEELGGTPLDHTLIAANYIVKDFEKKHGNQKTNVMVLTDGESHGVSTNESHFNSTYITNVGGRKYEFGRGRATQELTKLLKKNTGATLIGFYLPNSKQAGNRHLNKMAYNCDNTNSSMAYKTAGENMKKYRKEGFFLQNDCFGYDAYFLLNADMQIKDDEFDFTGSEGKALTDNRGEQSKLARQFAKHNTENRKNRIIMTKFAEIIA